jgi:hypothetical protein
MVMDAQYVGDRDPCVDCEKHLIEEKQGAFGGMPKPDGNDPRSYDLIPPVTMESLTQYVENGRPVGGFLRAVISNDLLSAVRRADMENDRAIVALAVYIYNQTPDRCHGSQENYMVWLGHYGLSGLEAHVKKMLESSL